MMAPGRAKRHARATGSTGSAASENDGVPQIFKDMLKEEGTEDIASYRGNKRRRVGDRVVRVADASPEAEIQAPTDEHSAQPQTITDLDQDSEEDDFEWEEVDTLGITSVQAREETSDVQEQLSIVLDDPNATHKPAKRRVRKPVSASEKRIRLDVHKVHLLCLMFHAYQRNHWCNDIGLQRAMRKQCKVSTKTVQKLHPQVQASQFQRSNWLKEVLKELSEKWRAMYSITLLGQKRASWDATPQTETRLMEAILDRREFIDRAASCRGSADYGAQLFCALLRGLGLEVRLVCSLQPLPFATSAAVVARPRVESIPTVYAIDSDDDLTLSDGVGTSLKAKGRRIARLGQSRRGQIQDLGTAPRAVSRKHREISRPRHPIFWVEVFDASYQSWISVDPMATGNMGKPLSLEPGLNDPENLLSYVLAFEEDNTARDVTRRYTKAYNAKTRKLRVECTDNGIKWYKRAMRNFRRRRKLDRDVVEEAYFTQRDMQEGMPKNIDDFRGHPVYVLERHLYRDEALHPKREVGMVTQATKLGTTPTLESVFRRQDVQHVKSADKWFRQGRRVKDGESPLKHVKARKRQELFEGEADDAVLQANNTLGLYAHFQTELYVPPAVTADGLLPRNEFGNLDVYTRSMIPAGAVHVKSPHARQAARLLGIDFVDAVTGFTFKGRQGTAVVNGVVVAAACREALEAALDGIVYTRAAEMAAARRDTVLALWRRFVLGVRIVENVKQYKRADESSDSDEGDEYAPDVDELLREQMDELEHAPAATSMLPEIEPYEVVESIHKLPKPVVPSASQIATMREEEEYGDGGFIRADDTFHHDIKFTHGGHAAIVERPLTSHDQGGGFLVEDSEASKTGNLEYMHMETLQEHEFAEAAMDDAFSGSPAEGDQSSDSLEEDAVDANEADKESLLSHDPADDELDPDWVD